MVDVVSPADRSRMMAGIQGKNTKPELIVRRMLFASGYRFRLHRRDLPGAPDIVMPGRKVAVFVHGCFWHGHDCNYFRLPSTRPEFWQDKIQRNHANDARHHAALLAAGWRIATVWECALRGRDHDVDQVADQLTQWVRGNLRVLEIR